MKLVHCITRVLFTHAVEFCRPSPDAIENVDCNWDFERISESPIDIRQRLLLQYSTVGRHARSSVDMLHFPVFGWRWSTSQDSNDPKRWDHKTHRWPESSATHETFRRPVGSIHSNGLNTRRESPHRRLELFEQLKGWKKIDSEERWSSVLVAHTIEVRCCHRLLLLLLLLLAHCWWCRSHSLIIVLNTRWTIHSRALLINGWGRN